MSRALAGRKVAKKWMRGPADALAVKQGCGFDPERGEAVIEFIEAFCHQFEGRWAGQPLILLEWQRDFIMRLFGWRSPSGLRRYRTAYLEVAKKNGKSTLTAALALYFLLADGEAGAQVHLNAYDRDQTDAVYKPAAQMVRHSPELESRLQVLDSRKRIVDHASAGLIRANSADVPSKDGANASAVIFDELHRQKTREMWNIFEYAGAAREQPIKLSITTAGEDETGVWHLQRDYSEQVNDGRNPDITHLGVVYRALPEDNIDDPATWRKANPSMGETIQEDNFGRELEKAKLDPEELANFMRLRLNIVVRSERKFFAPGVWERCNDSPEPLDDRPCWMGLDLSKVNDLTALAVLYGDDIDGYNVLARFWLPEDNIVELERENGVPYRMWAEQGWITLTPGNVVDYAWIRKEVIKLSTQGQLRKLLADPYAGTDLLSKLRDEDGLPVEDIRQGFLSLSPPTKELQRMVLGRKLRHGGNPILNWHAGNAIATQDDADNIKLSKKRSRQKIDGLAALVNAVAGATDGSEDQVITGPVVSFFTPGKG
jgi:phage terminase large subunit-like protein